MVEIVDDFINGINNFVHETPRSDNPDVLPLSVEDYNMALSLNYDIELMEKQKGKGPRGSDENYKDPTGGGEIFFKRPRIEGCPNLATWLDKKVDNPTINFVAIRDHLFECLGLKKDIAKWSGMDETELQS